MQRQLDVPASPAEQRVHHRSCRVRCRHGIIERDRRVACLALFVAHHLGQPAHRLRREAERQPVAVRTFRTVAWHGEVHQIRVGFREHLKPQAETRHRASAEVLQHRIRLAHQIQKKRSPGGLLEVEAHTSAVPVQLVEKRAVVPGLGTGLTAEEATEGCLRKLGRAASKRRLDAHDLRAEVGEKARTQRPGPDVREIKDANPLERPLNHALRALP